MPRPYSSDKINKLKAMGTKVRVHKLLNKLVYSLTSSMNCKPSLAASMSADLTKSMKPERHPLPTRETKCS